MRKAIIGMLLASTLAAPAMAQGWQGGNDNHDRQELRHDRGEVRNDRGEVRQDRREVRGDVRQGDFGEARRDQREVRSDRQDLRGDRRDLRGDRRDWRDDHGGPGYQGDRRWEGRGAWNNNWRQDRRYDWQGYRAANRGVYHLPRYFAPGGYGYRRYSAGYRIRPLFYSQRYWIADPWAYRLPPAYGGYRWVRYYNDALLIDVRTGLVADVINGLFW